jgi:predicted RNA-binding Zn-ribbon protein involved in translation (DUF1610 family)
VGKLAYAQRILDAKRAAAKAAQPEPNGLETGLAEVSRILEQPRRPLCVKCGERPEHYREDSEHMCPDCFHALLSARIQARRLADRRANIDEHLRRAGM